MMLSLFPFPFPFFLFPFFLFSFFLSFVSSSFLFPCCDLNCLDLNECTLGTNNCAGNGSSTCTNTFGSFTCACNSGYTGTGTSCAGQFFFLFLSSLPSFWVSLGSFSNPFLFVCGLVLDVNECSLGTANCASGGVSNCTNTIGSYYCTCMTGYAGNGTVCTGKIFRFQPLSYFDLLLSFFKSLSISFSFLFLFFFFFFFSFLFLFFSCFFSFTYFFQISMSALWGLPIVQVEVYQIAPTPLDLIIVLAILGILGLEWFALVGFFFFSLLLFRLPVFLMASYS